MKTVLVLLVCISQAFGFSLLPDKIFSKIPTFLPTEMITKNDIVGQLDGLSKTVGSVSDIVSKGLGYQISNANDFISNISVSTNDEKMKNAAEEAVKSLNSINDNVVVPLETLVDFVSKKVTEIKAALEEVIQVVDSKINTISDTVEAKIDTAINKLPENSIAKNCVWKIKEGFKNNVAVASSNAFGCVTNKVTEAKKSIIQLYTSIKDACQKAQELVEKIKNCMEQSENQTIFRKVTDTVKTNMCIAAISVKTAFAEIGLGYKFYKDVATFVLMVEQVKVDVPKCAAIAVTSAMLDLPSIQKTIIACIKL